MRLISLSLLGQYKGLKDQVFRFDECGGQIIALIGLNGSGKSQLLELIAEIFAFLERAQRTDFKVKTPLSFGFELRFRLDGETAHGAGDAGMECGEPTAVAGGIPKPVYKVILDDKSKEPTTYLWLEGSWQAIALQTIQLPYLVGYSSGLNENLQRSFMKNALYFEVQRIRHKRRASLTMELELEDVLEINYDYAKNTHIFFRLSMVKILNSTDTKA